MNCYTNKRCVNPSNSSEISREYLSIVEIQIMTKTEDTNCQQSIINPNLNSKFDFETKTNKKVIVQLQWRPKIFKNKHGSLLVIYTLFRKDYH